MLIRKNQYPILIFNILTILIFSFMFIQRTNFEFLIYVSVIIFFLLVVLFTNHKVNYPNIVLWALSIWAFLHMAGGAILIEGQVLYKFMLWNLVGEPYLILKYDQIVHAVGFYAATFTMYYVLKPHLKEKKSWFAVLLVVVMAGTGLGALNEIVEFLTTVIVPGTNVGGYVNNSIDLIANLIGAILAGVTIYFLERKK